MSARTSDRILAFVQETFRNRLDPGQGLSSSTPLFSSQLIDSMGLIELLAFLEKEFGVSMDATVDELTKLDTAANLAHEIERLQQARERV